LKNVPLRSGQEYQNFLDATSVEDDSNSLDGNTGPRNSTQNEGGRGQSFWRKFSFTRKSPRVPPKTNNGDDLEMGNILQPRNEPMASGFASVPLNPPENSADTIENENTLINE
jgi:hypothetical protein